MKKIETELCAFSPEAVGMAAAQGATRVELCSAPTEDGTTPSAAAIERAREAARSVANRPPVELCVMIRPRGGDFVYSDGEFETMKRDIAYAQQLGADGVVFGLLTSDGEVDVARTRELVKLAGSMESIFHKAFDAARNPARALEEIISTGCVRVLTSGQGRTASDGIEVLRELVKQADGRIEIMAGGGVNPLNGRELAEAGVDALHFSARGNTPDPQNPQISPEFIRRMVEIAEPTSR